MSDRQSRGHRAGDEHQLLPQLIEVSLDSCSHVYTLKCDFVRVVQLSGALTKFLSSVRLLSLFVSFKIYEDKSCF